MYLLTLITVVLAQGTAFADWRSTGPFGGDAEVIRVVPKVPGFVIAGAHNGLLYVSRNGGAFWTNIPFEGQSSGTLHALEVDPRSAGTWYAGMEGDQPWISGLYKTIDGGDSWTLLAGTKGKAVWSLTFWPSNPDIMAAGTGGRCLSQCRRGQELDPNLIGGQSGASSRGLACVRSGGQRGDLRRHDAPSLAHKNGGASWESIHTGMIDDSDVFSIQVDSHHPEQVYASACSGLYQSSDSAAHWNKLPTPKGAFRTCFVALDPRNSRTVFAGTTEGLLRSEDDGARVAAGHRASREVDRVRRSDTDTHFLCFRHRGPDGEHRRRQDIAGNNAGFTNRNFTVLTGAKGVLYASSVFEPGSGGIYRTDNYGSALAAFRRRTGPGYPLVDGGAGSAANLIRGRLSRAV